MRFLLAFIAAISLCVVPAPSAAADAAVPQPIDGNCESWRPLFDKYRLPFDRFRPIMWRETRCRHLHNWNRRTRDDSIGVVQVNRWGMDAKWTAAGFPRWFHNTPEGGVAAAAFLYHACNRKGNGGMGPWTKPYRCRGGWPL